MIGRTAIAAMLAVGMLVSSAVAQIDVVEEVPATRQTPRGTLKLLQQAIDAGDGEALRSILVGQTPQEQRMVEAMAQMAVNVQRLREAAIAAFGEAAARELTGGPVDKDADPMKELDTATETIDGQSAVVRFADVQAEPVKLVLNGDQWQVPVAELAAELNERELEARIAEVQVFNEVIAQITDEISQQKFTSAEQATQALYNRMMQAMTRHEGPAPAPVAPPSTAPATAPATAPETTTVPSTGPVVQPMAPAATQPAGD